MYLSAVADVITGLGTVNFQSIGAGRLHSRMGIFYGIRLKLYAAFAAMALLTLLMAVGAARLFDLSSETLLIVTEKRVPEIVILSEFAQQVNALSTEAPLMILAANDRELTDHAETLELIEEQIRFALLKIDPFMGRYTSFDQVISRIGQISAHLQLMISAKRHSFKARSAYAQNAAFIEMLQGDAAALFAAVSRTETQSFILHLNRAIWTLSDVPQAVDSDHLDRIADRIATHIEQAEALSTVIPDQETWRGARALIGRLRHLALGGQGLVEGWRTQLHADRVATDRLSDVEQGVNALTHAVNAWLKQATDTVSNDRQMTEQQLRLGRWGLAALSVTAFVAAFLIACVYVGRRIVGRVNRLSQSMRAIAMGHRVPDLDFRGNDEISAMAASLSVFKGAMRELRHQAVSDRITGIGNRSLIENDIGIGLAEPGNGTVYLINIKGFSELNDSFGVDFCDEVLCIVAGRLLSGTEGLSSAARLRSDRFAVLQLGVTNPAEIAVTAASILTLLSQTMSVQGLELNIRPELGIARFPVDGRDPDLLLRRADLAMGSLPDGQNFQLYEASIGDAAGQKNTIRRDLRAAIEQEDLFLVYQPKLNLQSNQIYCVEALGRWRHPTQGLISPSDFIPIAERSGLIVGLGDYVMRQACRAARSWQDDHGLELKIAVNVSPVQLTAPDFVERVARILRETRLAPDMLELEVTEGVFVGEDGNRIDRLRELTEMGVSLSIDDFGTGYSSIGYLGRLPISTLKVDRSFVTQATEGAQDDRLCRAIISIAKEMSLSVVAEGVENEEQLTLLRRENCEFAQGFLISRPVSSEELVRFIKAFKNSPALWKVG